MLADVGMRIHAVRTVTLPNGTTLPQIGLGTWGMGESAGSADAEAAAIAHALDAGVQLMDTAEVLGRALRMASARPYIVSKVYPYNASRQGVVEACEGSLRRIGVDQIDLYLLHWRGSVPIAETIEGFERLVAAGKIGAWGVSNFDADDMAELWAAPGGEACQTNQVLYNLTRRWPEDRLLPAQAERRMPLMAYSPLEQGALADDGALDRIAKEAGLNAMQLALAWTLRRGDIFSVPKSRQPERINGFLAAADLTLSDDIQAALDAAFPSPPPGAPLEML
jgi:diketogulonate reductase-like aldo/keto reductase